MSTVRLCFTRHLPGFQSAPLTEARGDTNNVPSMIQSRAMGNVSIRSPYRSKGRSIARDFQRCPPSTLVSIRSPYRSKGRCTLDRQRFARFGALFQSAPLTEARGDHLAPGSCVVDFRGPVSIRSPYRSKGRSGNDPLASWRARNRVGFNPLPLPKQGEIPSQIGSGHVGAARCVSIRSPYRSKGRWVGKSPCIDQSSISWFQSAPLTEARGDSKQEPVT